MSPVKPTDSVPALLAYSLAIEREAVERYSDLADQMEIHNNPEVAALFRRLAEIEEKHVATVQAEAHGRLLPHLAPWDFDWGEETESPEGPHDGEAHYLMTPHHALALALAGEERARRFFERVADGAGDPAVRRLAASLRDEEAEHVELVRRWLERFPAPAGGWDEDPDPPLGQE